MGVPTTKNMTGSEYGLYRAFGILPAPPDPKEAQPISEFFRDINDAVVGYCRQEGMDVPKILIEPGRLLTSRAEFLLTAIHSIKERPPDAPFAITDVGRLSVTFPCEFEYHEMFLANRPLAEPEVPYNIVGRICTSADWLARNRLLPRLTPADTIAIMDAGAYFSSNASNFAFPRPRIVSISEGEARIIRDEESFEHLTAMDEAWHAEA
jgi:diaminopimelate decarboxylase